MLFSLFVNLGPEVSNRQPRPQGFSLKRGKALGTRLSAKIVTLFMTKMAAK